METRHFQENEMQSKILLERTFYKWCMCWTIERTRFSLQVVHSLLKTVTQGIVTSRQLILQKWKQNFILLLFSGKAKDCHCIHQSTVQIFSLWRLIFHYLPWDLLGSTMITWYSYLGCSQREGVWGSKTYWWENLNPSDSFTKRLKPKHLVIQYCSTSWNHKRICSHPYGLSVRPHHLPVN